MIGAVPRGTRQVLVQDNFKKESDAKPDDGSNINKIQSSIANSIEELAMARSLYQAKDKKSAKDELRELGDLLRGDAETDNAVNSVLKTGVLTKENVSQILLQLKNDVSRYQLLRYLLAGGNVSAELYQFLFEEMEKLKRKRKKITSLDKTSSDAIELSKNESMSTIDLQELYLSFLEADGHICPYYEELYKKNKKHNKITRFISKMLGCEIYGLTPKDDFDFYIHISEKRKNLNMMNDLYSALELKNGFHDLDFVPSILMNVDAMAFFDTLQVEQASALVDFFLRVPQSLFFSPEDKEEVISAMKNNITNRFKRQWI
ncbi:MAG: hypothetical protein ACRC7P_01140 [Enterovibrio sp.]